MVAPEPTVMAPETVPVESNVGASVPTVCESPTKIAPVPEARLNEPDRSVIEPEMVFAPVKARAPGPALVKPVPLTVPEMETLPPASRRDESDRATDPENAMGLRPLKATGPPKN